MNHKTFVLAWVEAYNKSLGVRGVATKLNIPVKQASAKANYLRKQGVELPHMPRSRSDDYTVDELNQLIESRTAAQ